MTVAAISAFMPTITSSGIFSTRRTNSGVDALDTNPIVGLMNLEIAGGQMANAARGTIGIAKESSGRIANKIISAEEAIKNTAKTDKIFRGAYKTIDFATSRINTLIGITGALRVAFAEDKKREAIEQGAGLGLMFACENAYKNAFGVPIVKKFNKDNMAELADGIYENVKGKKKLVVKKGKYSISNNKLVIERDAWYKKSDFLVNKANIFKKSCAETKFLGKSLKFMPGVLKGVGFAVASIGGYYGGLGIANSILGERKDVA